MLPLMHPYVHIHVHHPLQLAVEHHLLTLLLPSPPSLI
jgi:hypothetical protein